MQSKHNPERFAQFVELADGSGFTLPGCQFIFKYDQYNGWYDENGLYYNSYGEPDSPPKEQNNEDYDYDDEEGEYDDYENEELENELMQEFDLGNEYDEYPQQNKHHFNQLQKIEDLQFIIDQYGSDQQIEIYLTNLNFKLGIQQIAQFFLQNYNQPRPDFRIEFGEKRGSAYLKTKNKQFAKHCALKVHEIFMERKLYMEIEPLEQNDDCLPIQTQKVEVQEKKQELKQEEKKVEQKEKEIVSTEKQNSTQIEEKKKENNEQQQQQISTATPAQEDDDEDEWGTIGKKKRNVRVVYKTAATQQTKKQTKKETKEEPKKQTKKEAKEEPKQVKK